MTITNRVLTGRVDTFEVVDKIPSGYVVWNITPIGENGDYIPLALVDKNCSVDLSTLKAIKVGADKASIISRATSYGMGDIESTRKAVLGKRVNKEKRRRAMLALPIYEEIS